MMQFKKAINNIIKPIMESNNFSLLSSAVGFCEYKNRDDTIRIVIDKNPWLPAELRLKLCYRDHFVGFSSFELTQLADYQSFDLMYTNQYELEAKLRLVAESLETNVISLGIQLRDNHVFDDERFTISLSANPQKQSICFACRHSLPVTYEFSNLLYLESLITEMRGNIIYQWRSNFATHYSEIIDLVSYYGEVIRKKDQGRANWNWGTNNSFGLEYDEGWHYPQSDVIDYWNYGLYMPAFRILPPEFR